MDQESYCQMPDVNDYEVSSKDFFRSKYCNSIKSTKSLDKEKAFLRSQNRKRNSCYRNYKKSYEDMIISLMKNQL